MHPSHKVFRSLLIFKRKKNTMKDLTDLVNIEPQKKAGALCKYIPEKMEVLLPHITTLCVGFIWRQPCRVLKLFWYMSLKLIWLKHFKTTKLCTKKKDYAWMEIQLLIDYLFSMKEKIINRLPLGICLLSLQGWCFTQGWCPNADPSSRKEKVNVDN